MKKNSLFSSLITLTFFLVLTSCEQEELVLDELNIDRPTGIPTYVGNTPLRPDPNAKLLYGRPYGEWTKDWWKYMLSLDCTTNPLTTGLNTTTQRGPVVFLAGPAHRSSEIFITVQKNQVLLLPVINKLNNASCPDLVAATEGGGSLEQQLKAGADKYIDLASNLKVTVDGRNIPVTHQNRFATNVFYFKGNEGLKDCLDTCISGDTQAAVSDGYWVFINKLPAGRHVVRVHAEILRTGVVIDVFYNIVSY